MLSSAASRSVALNRFSSTERILYWTIVLTPLWWLLGIQTLFYPALSAGLFLRAFDIDTLSDTRIAACVWAWLAVAITMMGTAIIGLSGMGFPTQQTAAAFITFLKGYFLIFSCMALPFFCRVRVKVITRAVVWMTIGYLVTIAIELAMLVSRIGPTWILPPLARLIPGDKLSLRITFAEFQPFFGISFPRTVMYTPDPPIVGVCAVLCLFICLGETNPRLRRWAMAGCLLALLASFSRLAWVSLPLLLLLSACFRSLFARLGALWATTSLFLLSGIFGITVIELFEKPLEIFNKARPDSTTDRALVVGKTLEAWQESPWIGWGVIQGSVRWYIYDIALGSFSTYASVLYLHGIVGFVVFVSAMALTLWDLVQTALRGSVASQRAFASVIGLYILCSATTLTWMAVYFWFFFVWLGAILYSGQRHFKGVSEWEQLAINPTPPTGGSLNVWSYE